MVDLQQIIVAIRQLEIDGEGTILELFRIHDDAHVIQHCLRVYERTALFGETLEIVYYSPEIDTKLKIISFPTFKGHCGCMLFKQTDIQTVVEYAAP